MLRHARADGPAGPAPTGTVPVPAGLGRLLRKASGHREAGRLREAERGFQHVLAVAPGHPIAHYELGILASGAGAPASAVPHLAAALRAAPDQPGYWLALATALLAADRLADARAILERFQAQGFAGAGAVTDGLAARVFAEARLRADAGDLVRAEALLDAVVLLDDRHAEAVHLAGTIAARTNRLERAFNLLRIAVDLDPTNAACLMNFGTVLSRQGHLPGAVAAFERSVALDPDRAIARSNLGGAYHRQGRMREALDQLQAALVLDPDLANAHCNHGVVLKELGRLEEAIHAFDRALALDPTMAFVHSNRLFAKLYAGHVAPADYATDARDYGRRFADPVLRQRPFANDRDPARRLRVGFVSGDLRQHAVAFFFEPFLVHLDKARFETFAYTTNAGEDAVSARLKAEFAHWCTIDGLDDDEAADRVEADRIDVLVDLSGHSAGNRLPLFARKPAPVQVTWIGHPATTGLAAMDYRLTDRVTDPAGTADALHTETLWRLPAVQVCYGPPSGMPAVAPPPFEANGHVTFGCFNRFTKVSDVALAAWAAILAAMPDARMLFEVAGTEAPDILAATQARLARCGLPLERIDIEPRLPRNRYTLYARVDVALDPFPYNGGTTSLDTLYMGVPFVALAGDHTAGRQGVCILTFAGLPDLAAPDPEAYIVRALDLARDRERLRALRQGLRGRMLASRHMDHGALAEDVGAAFRTFWQRWLET